MENSSDSHAVSIQDAVYMMHCCFNLVQLIVLQTEGIMPYEQVLYLFQFRIGNPLEILYGYLG